MPELEKELAEVLVEEAKGRLTRFDGSLFDTDCGQIVASNALIHDDMLGVIASRH